MSDSQIKSLFYKPEIHANGTIRNGTFLYPPPHRRRTAQQIREFFKLGWEDKRTVISDAPKWTIDSTNMVTYLESSFAASEEVNPGVREDDASVRSDHVAVDFLPDPNASDGDSSASDDNTCPGITLSYISSMKLDAEGRSCKSLGFKHVCREGFTTRAEFEHPSRADKWPFQLPIVGALSCGLDPNKLIWKVEELADYENNQPILDGPEFERFNIRHVDCTSGNTQSYQLRLHSSSCISIGITFRPPGMAIKLSK